MTEEYSYTTPFLQFVIARTGGAFSQNMLAFFHFGAGRMRQGKGQDAVDDEEEAADKQTSRHAYGETQVLPVGFARFARMGGEGGDKGFYGW